ncbi:MULTISPECIES: YtcA family lipoprotein [Providencia]|nr:MULTISPECIES: YtcA family lipoprotein [Providencia]APC13337.1 hypothetical protein RB151_036880 [Providencia rettgeri]MDU7494097.1 YtcA family lipoprotein [Providencia rettgeri]MDV5233951.1 YtcA family lipoprotein [Providencia rettgeri]
MIGNIDVNLLKKYCHHFSISLLAFLLVGCTQGNSPLFPMLGAYFPYWMLCVLIGLIGAVLLRVLLVRLEIDDKLPLPLLFYFGVLLSIAITISLLYFSH